MSSRHRCRYTAGTVTAAPGSTGWSSIVIRIHFPDPDDSPTRRSPLRVRYTIARDEAGRMAPVLHYAHGTRQLTREAWRGFRKVWAVLEASTEREQSIVREALGDDCLSLWGTSHTFTGLRHINTSLMAAADAFKLSSAEIAGMRRDFDGANDAFEQWAKLFQNRPRDAG